MSQSMIGATRLLAGPPVQAGPESLRDQRARLGPLPAARRDLIATLDRSGLLGRGGGAFPVGRKWAKVADAGGGDARVLVNGAEGEPLSAKDCTLMTARPHLVLDGAQLAAAAVGAREIVLYVSAAQVDARAALGRALAERGRPPVATRLVAAPDAFVAGEESAAVHFINEGDARPTTKPPRPFENGIGGRPTLVQNVETLAHVALIARYGDAWYRSAGRGATRGTTLVTLNGASGRVVREVELGTRVGEVAALTGDSMAATRAVLLGGYFGAWLGRDAGWGLPLDPLALRAAGAALGSGVVAFLPAASCGVASTALIIDWLAAQSAAQCGPCVFGLRAIADALGGLSRNAAASQDLERVKRWGGQLAGRGACRHPDGAAGLLASALVTFAEDFERHARRAGCVAQPRTAQAA